MPTVAIHGAAGRMGRRLATLAMEDHDLVLVGAIDCPGHECLGLDVGTIAGTDPTGITLSTQWPSKVDVTIDFSSPAGAVNALSGCVNSGSAIVIGTTGLQEDVQGAIDAAARTIAVLQAPNMSLGVNLLFALAAQSARQLGEEYDIEIIEAHHRFKVDAPSGTAFGIAEAICQATDRDMKKDVVFGRHGSNVPRRPGEIGVHSLRLGDEVGRHSVSFAMLGEQLQLTHVATTRDVFVRGALAAAKWLAEKPAGRYRMADVLGL